MAWKHYSDIFYHQVEKYGDQEALFFHNGSAWEPISWRQFGENVRHLSAALIDCGIGVQDRIGIFSGNCPEWSMADLAAICIRAVPTPIHATSTTRQAAYMVQDSGMTVIFVGNQTHYDAALEIQSQNKALHTIVAFDPQVQLKAGTNSFYFQGFMKKGRQASLDDAVAERGQAGHPDDLLTIIYTSGTTGDPKGVMLTHGNILFQAKAHDLRLMHTDENDISLYFLPLSHVFERVWSYYVFYRGIKNYYLSDPKKVIDVVQEVRPTVMCAVPRFYEKIYAAIHNRLESSSAFRKRLFNWAVKVGERHYHYYKEKISFREPLISRLRFMVADRLVLKKIRAVTGGRIRFFPCAGAPLSAEIETFFYSVGIFVAYGYGLTETSATVTVHEEHYFEFGAVGKPMPGIYIRIDPVTSEVLAKGDNVMVGYYNKPEATAEVFTEDGYFRTGDAGRFEDNGELRITERIKELIKTSGGKYVAPQLLESTLGADHFIEQLAVIGEGKKYIVALVVPDFDALESYAGEQGIPFSDRDELIRSPDINEIYQKRIEMLSQDFSPHERIKKITLLSRPFEIERNEITPTLKLRRKVIQERYSAVIAAMYAE